MYGINISIACFTRMPSILPPHMMGPGGPMAMSTRPLFPGVGAPPPSSSPAAAASDPKPATSATTVAKPTFPAYR